MYASFSKEEAEEEQELRLQSCLVARALQKHLHLLQPSKPLNHTSTFPPQEQNEDQEERGCHTRGTVKAEQ